MKLLLKIVALFWVLKQLKTKAGCRAMSDISVFLQNFVGFSLKVSQPCFSHCRASKLFYWIDPSGSHLLHVSPWYLFTLFLSARALFDIIIKHSRDSKSYFAHFFDFIAHYFSLFTLFPSIFFFPSNIFFYLVGNKYCIIWYELSCYGVPLWSKARAIIAIIGPIMALVKS